jgi:predicted ester cyclase
MGESDGDDGEALVRRYVQFISGSAGTGSGIEDILTDDFFDHVSGQRGAAIWAQVAQWAKATFADPAVDVHEIMSRGDRVLVWMTVTATHVGGGFPRLRGIPVTGKRVAWPQVHIFRVTGGLLAEHWAVRDDYAMVEAIVGGGPLAPPHVD